MIPNPQTRDENICTVAQYFYTGLWGGNAAFMCSHVIYRVRDIMVTSILSASVSRFRVLD
jgi:hypothetical protein